MRKARCEGEVRGLTWICVHKEDHPLQEDKKSDLLHVRFSVPGDGEDQIKDDERRSSVLHVLHPPRSPSV